MTRRGSSGLPASAAPETPRRFLLRPVLLAWFAGAVLLGLFVGEWRDAVAAETPFLAAALVLGLLTADEPSPPRFREAP